MSSDLFVETNYRYGFCKRRVGYYETVCSSL